MSLDFEDEYGVNAGYVQVLFEDWRRDPASVDAAWRKQFEHLTGSPPFKPAVETSPTEAPQSAKRQADSTSKTAAIVEEGSEFELLTGVAARIVTNMTASLELPTATSARTLPAKVLSENRRVLNEHMQLRALGKASFTHLIAFALARALGEMPRMIASFVEKDGRGHRRLPDHVNLGLAIDVPGRDGRGRMLVVPSIKSAETLNFREFHAAYEEIVRRGREGKLGPADYGGTNVTLTNPGGFGTEMSVPRLMKGQGLIVATGSIAVPPTVRSASAASLAELAIGPVMTVTSTYDHRVIQGAESGLFLKLVEELLEGEHGFYEEIYRAMRLPWTPYVAAHDTHSVTTDAREESDKQTRVWELINAYRVRGCRLADLDPLEYKPDLLDSLDPSKHGFTIWDLDRTFNAGGMLGKQEMTLREILEVLRRSYCRRWTVEYMHIADREPKWWIRERIENPEYFYKFSRERIIELVELLFHAENFEHFLHTQYVGNKRFSLEGADTLIPALAEAIENAADQGVESVVIGMAHRGRLNVLANILEKPYEQIFREFQGVLLPLSSEGSGDVKYHLGQRGTYQTRSGKSVEVFLSPNPSHLEAVDPVVCGMTRAYQDALHDEKRGKVLAILIHGDAAFSGQGVVAETFNMSRLPATRNGGTLHIVVNNQIGFTASPRDLRSTYYCTDFAKGVQVPILHANGDYPESVLRAVRLAVDYQHTFGEDVVVDMVCYRRWGHNEGDEPAYTQPVLYSKIRKHPTVCQNYTNLLLRRGDLEQSEIDEIEQRFDAELNQALIRTKNELPVEVPPEDIIDLDDDEPTDFVTQASPTTGLSADQLVEIVDATNLMPEGHVVHPNLLRQLRRRETMVRGELAVDWGCAEALAFGSLLQESVSIRLAGQDSGRGTFSHRHAVIRDQVTEYDHVPLRGLATGGAEFNAWDSLLSEEAALAFEYGYSLARPDVLVLWEAQFGDFVNGAQIAIDQFISAGEAKWKVKSGVTMLLPHGFDGMGPEHSSARPERFLALCSGGNMTVANCSTSVQYFHLLRRQGLASDKRPLIIFTPKSLLRDKRAASAVGDFTSGGFQELLPDPKPSKNAKRLILCTGKVFYDLEAYRAEHNRDDVELLRVEQMYPLPWSALAERFSQSPDAELIWCQEEPRNMGAWPFMLQRFADQGVKLRYAGRPDAPSPATGSYHRHQAEQLHLVRRAFE
ncbi:MAG: 2-oxoglutarate decarboxylase [Planctomycetota bacterium]|jgi:2-oxoglutarate decarboxylase